MDLHYGICYYIGKDKKSNIINHYKAFNQIPQKNKTFWISFTIDEKDPHKRSLICKNKIKSLNIKISYVHDYNWGGTIAALFKLFQNLQTKKGYLAFFEEDFIPINTKWLPDSIKYLQNNYYIGEGTIPSIDHPDLCQVKVCDSRYMKSYKFKKLYQNEAWTDGGFYFSTIQKFSQIYSIIGIFHKGDQNNKYDHGNDGIDYGEVGFPTLLFNNKLKFAGLLREKYFIHNENEPENITT